MTTPTRVLRALLTHRAAQARALARRVLRVNTRNRLTRARTRLLLGMGVLTLLVLVPAGLAIADPGDGAANTWVGTFGTKDSQGIPMSAYRLSIDEGGVSNPKNMFASTFLQLMWELYRIYVGTALWLFDYALQFQMLDMLRGPATAVAEALQSTIGQIGIIPALTVVTFGICAVWIQTGKSASGLAGLFIALLMGSLLTTAAVRPMEVIAGDDGLLVNSRDLGVGLSSQVVSGGESDSTEPEELQSRSSAKLVDVFIRTPHQLVNYGAAIDKDAKCVKVYDEDLKKGYPANGGDDDRPRKNMGKCNKAYLEAADNPINGLIGMVFLYPSGGTLVLFFVGLALVLNLLIALAMFEATRAGWVMLKAIIPGGGTAEIWSAICIVGVVAGYIVATLMGIGAFLLLFEALMTADGLDPRMVYILIDGILLVSLVVMGTQLMRARKQGKKLGEKIQAKTMPAARSVDTATASPMRAVTSAASLASPAASMLTARKLGRPSGAGANAGQSGALADARPQTTGSTMGGAVKGTGKLAWSATKLGLASTVGAPVYAPRAYGAVKAGMSAKRTQMGEKFTKARQDAAQRVDARRTQATDFGREYVHNLGVAGRAVSKYSGASKIATTAMALGADPLTSAAAGAAVHLGRAHTTPREPQMQRPAHRPAPTTSAPHHRAESTTSTRQRPPSSTTSGAPSATSAPSTTSSRPTGSTSATTLPTVQVPKAAQGSTDEPDTRDKREVALDRLVSNMAARHAARGTLTGAEHGATLRRSAVKDAP